MNSISLFHDAKFPAFVLDGFIGGFIGDIRRNNRPCRLFKEPLLLSFQGIRLLLLSLRYDPHRPPFPCTSRHISFLAV